MHSQQRYPTQQQRQQYQQRQHKQQTEEPHSLNYFQQAPVRGQLEPADGYSRTGWRYLQCTDTPNELRVLLPPRTALIYGHLLKAESVELAKDSAASWDLIMQIRHLKDRMIRKCQRLAKSSTAADKNTARVMFFTIHAPPDFRLKEMERWFRSQGPEFGQVETQQASSTPYCCSKCGPLPNAPASRNTALANPQTMTTTTYSRRPSVVAHRSSHTKAILERVSPKRPNAPPNPVTTTTPYDHRSAPRKSESRQQPLPVPTRARTPSGQYPSATRQHQQSATPPSRQSPGHSRSHSPAHSARIESHPLRASIKSPDPIPIPFRSRDHELDELDDDYEDEDDIDIPVVTHSPEPIVQSPPPQSSPPPREHSPPSPPSSAVATPDQVPFPSMGGLLETIHEDRDNAARPTLLRRRSSLKKCGSISRLSVVSQTKSVSWAMDKDWVEQMSKYTKATNEAEVIAQELEEIRTVYHQQIAEMKDICRNLTAASERLRVEAENLHREENEVGVQEAKLLASCEKLEMKESQYREKVLAVLDETKHVVALCDKKRDQHDT